jgi:hypothetical protein
MVLETSKGYGAPVISEDNRGEDETRASYEVSSLSDYDLFGSVPFSDGLSPYRLMRLGIKRDMGRIGE